MKRTANMTLGDRLGYALDRFVGIFKPDRGMERMAARAGMRSYRAARTDRRRRRNAGGGGSADFHDEHDREELREKCRDSVRNDAFVKGLVRLSVNNVLGHDAEATGYEPRPGTPDDEWNRMAVDRFTDWARNECDVYGHQSLREMAAMCFEENLQAGESVNIMLSRSPVSGKLQAVDPERLVQPPPGEGDRFEGPVKFGIHRSASTGRPMHYWIAPYTDTGYRVDHSEGQWVHEMDVLHSFRKRRASQTRGISELAPALDDLEMMNQYSEAELMGAHVAACAGIWVPNKGSNDRLPSGHPDEAGDADENYRPSKMEPAMIYQGRPGEDKPEVIDPKKPAEQYADFFEAQARVCMFALGIPLEMFSWGASSYSTARSALLQAYRTFRRHQIFLVEHFFRPIWRWKISQFIKYGDIRAPREGDPWDHSWIVPGWDWINPLDETRAGKEAIDSGMSSLTRELALKGEKVEEVLDERAEELKIAEEKAEKYDLDDPNKIIDRAAYRDSLEVGA
jgi:lambda family phage portal protein